MKLYDSATAPNPRRVRIFLAEKGVSVPTESIDIGARENDAPEFLAKNALGRVPLLELDDGTTLAESVAICRYFEALYPDPPLFGRGAEESARVEMWNRRMEFELLGNTAGAFRNLHDFFAGRYPQFPDFGENCKRLALERFAWLDGELADREFVAGDAFTIADITALVAVDFGRVTQIRVAPEQKNLARWHAAVSARPSAKA